jgi:hypothetical protein
MKYAACLALTCLLAPAAARAQVGHRPADSPYRDIFKGHTVTGLGGYLGGSGGRFGIAPHKGAVYAVRYDLRTASALQFGLEIGQADLERFVIDPDATVATRVSGPVSQRLSFAEVDLQLNITGGKTWNRLAPFFGLGAGLAHAGDTDEDTSGFKFGNKIYFVPHAGFRFFPTSRLHLRADARVAFWKLKYPDSFTEEPDDEPGDPPDNSNAVIPDGSVSEWATAPWLQVGLGYSLSF